MTKLFNKWRKHIKFWTHKKCPYLDPTIGRLSYHVIKWKHFPRYWLYRASTQRPVTRSFDVFFDLRLNKQFSQQSWGWWFETPSRSLWRHCNVVSIAENIVRVIKGPHYAWWACRAPSQYKDRLFRYGDPHIKDKRSRDRLIFNNGIIRS